MTKTTRKIVGKVTNTECDEIRTLFERKNALTELFKIVDTNNEVLYEKVVADMGKTTSKFQAWWDEKAKKYDWESVEGGSWEIDFNSCEVLLKQ